MKILVVMGILKILIKRQKNYKTFGLLTIVTDFITCEIEQFSRFLHV